jgi:undecaprenyl-diphosphatase
VDEEQRHRFFELHVHALVLAAFLLIGGTVLTLVIKPDPIDPPVQPLDDWWLNWMLDLRVPAGVEVAKIVSAFGNAYILWPIRVAAGAILAWRRQWLQLSAFVLAVLSSELLIGPVKAWVDRPRPPDPLVTTTSMAYPSGHAIAAAVTAFAIVVVFVPSGRGGRRLHAIGAAAAVAAVMALARTYLSAHWLTDVIGGGMWGVALALLWPAGFELIRERRLERAAALPEIRSSSPPSGDSARPSG